MFKILLCLLFSAVWAMERDVDMYSDETPKRSFVFQRFEPKNLMSESSPIQRSIDYVKNMFVNAGYIEFPMENAYTVSSKDTVLFYCFVSLDKKDKHSFFVDFIFDCYRTTEELFSSIKLNLPGKINYWSYPVVVKGWGGCSEESREMSWRNIAHILHSRFIPWVSGGKTSIVFKNDAVEKLYASIKEHGLENCIARILITKQARLESYNFYILYDSEEEKEISIMRLSNEKRYTCSLV